MRDVEKIQYVRVSDAVRYLTSMGWKISDKSMYRHIKQGKLTGKPWSKELLDQYAAEFLQPAVKPSVSGTRPGTGIARELIAARRKKIAVETRLKNFELAQKRDDLIPLDDINRIYAQACSRMLTAIKNLGSEAGYQICVFFKGDQSKIVDFQWAWAEYSERWLAEFMESWRRNGVVKIPKVNMKDILQWYEDIAADHRGESVTNVTPDKKKQNER